MFKVIKKGHLSSAAKKQSDERTRQIKIKNCDAAVASEYAKTASNGTKVNNGFMVKADGTRYERVIIKRSNRIKVMSWVQI